jgi:hypothetical protein
LHLNDVVAKAAQGIFHGAVRSRESSAGIHCAMRLK